METGLQQAEEQIQSMLAGNPPDTQQQMDSDTAEEVQEEVQTESETSEPELTEQEETEEVTEQESSEEQYYPIKLDGEDMEITLDEALKGYQRQSDYTKKTQALADERKQLEAAKQDILRQREYYKQNVDKLILEQQAQTVKEPDWDKLYEADPLEWMRQKEAHRSQKEKALELKQEQFRLQQEQYQEQNAQMQEYLTQQHDVLINTIPEWKDPQVMQREKNEIKMYAQSIGYTPNEISQIYDSRAVLALRAGMKASGLSGKGATKLKPVREAIRPISPGSAAQQPKKHTAVSKAKQKLAKTGKMSDAEQIFKHLL
ncbi:MAG: putative scaffolding protein [Prokaryotic dsDNA virus sp.]|nr:MAG: putative scaffolding protein [Prokaryotic dsDNA virus sp.]|tara:strand:- start:6616 stop:7563 length:948 start_codon:yes stop_codon:yes gene_type:complete